jgi:Tfp pilus assembly protein PilF
MNLYEDEIVNTLASIGPGTLPLDIRLPQAKLQKPVSGTVSVRQLNHPLSRQVQKLLQSGHRLIQDRQFDVAAQRFREAAQDDPDCVQAHADLALALSKMQSWEAAAAEYRAAVSLEPRNSILHSNLGAALACLKRLDEAQTEALLALKLDAHNVRAHYVLAGVMLQKSAPSPDVLQHLMAAQSEIPSARTAIERICAANRMEGCP